MPCLQLSIAARIVQKLWRSSVRLETIAGVFNRDVFKVRCRCQRIFDLKLACEPFISYGMNRGLIIINTSDFHVSEFYLQTVKCCTAQIQVEVRRNFIHNGGYRCILRSVRALYNSEYFLIWKKFGFFSCATITFANYTKLLCTTVQSLSRNRSPIHIDFAVRILQVWVTY